MRGSFKKKKAKVIAVNHKKSRVALENIQRSKKDGAKVNVHFHPSNLQIIALNLDDKKRMESLSRTATKKTVKQDNKKTAPEKKVTVKEKKNASNKIWSK